MLKLNAFINIQSELLYLKIIAYKSILDEEFIKHKIKHWCLSKQHKGLKWNFLI